MVQKDKKWGIFDIKGNSILPVEFDEFGCTSSGVKDISTNALLIIPRVEGIVVCKDKKYGIYSSEGKELFPVVLDAVYSTTSAGIDAYYMMYDGIRYSALEKINQYTTSREQNNTVNTNVQNNVQNNMQIEPEQLQPEQVQPEQIQQEQLETGIIDEGQTDNIQ